MTTDIALGDRLAIGNTAEVFKGTEGDREYAVKVLHAHLADDPIVLSRFVREAEMLVSLAHPNIVRVYGVAYYDGRPGMVMELLPVGSLRGRLLTPHRTMALLRDLCSALVLLHGRGVVHRDIRPEHILFSADGTAKLTDFGMASVRDLSGLTRSTIFASQLTYADPYTWGRTRPQPIQDIYSLGAVFFESLVGSPPPSALFGEVGDAQREAQLAEVRESGHVIGDVIRGMLEPPARRPRSAQEILDWIDAGHQHGVRDISECIHCGAAMPREAPVCLQCSKPPLAVELDPNGEFLVLRKISEDRSVLSPFLRKLRLLSATPIEEPRILIGDVRFYSREEQRAGARLPVRIVEGVASGSVGPLMDALQGSSGKIRITRHPMGPRWPKRGPLIRLKTGTILPPATVNALRSLSADFQAQRSKQSSSIDELRRDCAYAIGIAARHVADHEGALDDLDVKSLGATLNSAVDRLERTERYLQSVSLHDAYATFERGESAGAAEELFRGYADAEQQAARTRQKITDACRVLESLSAGGLSKALQRVVAILDDVSEATPPQADMSAR
jgi:serine/threonine protein kinase